MRRRNIELNLRDCAFKKGYLETRLVSSCQLSWTTGHCFVSQSWDSTSNAGPACQRRWDGQSISACFYEGKIIHIRARTRNCLWVDLRLGQRRRRWPNVKQTHGNLPCLPGSCRLSHKHLFPQFAVKVLRIARIVSFFRFLSPVTMQEKGGSGRPSERER